MSRIIPACIIALAASFCSTVLASAQVTSSPQEQDKVPSAPVAIVYVTSNTSGATNVINGYSVAANGALTLIPGSPFHQSVNYLALNGKWLFGVNSSGDASKNLQFIDSFSIASNGKLAKKDEVQVAESGGGVVNIFLDHTGSSLYADYYTANNDFLTYSIDQSTGSLSYISSMGGGPANNGPLSFIGSNVFAYSSSCYHFDPLIFGVQRGSDGTLSSLGFLDAPFPTEKSGGFYCPWMAAADPTNHLAVALEPFTADWGGDGPWQLASYTVDASGNLSTTSTASNMPVLATGAPSGYSMSPSGKYLAVGGLSGLQIFHFNGANPITKFTGLLTTKQIDQLFWDNSNHLYAISRSAGKLFVFTVSSTGVKQAPGSPHAITRPVNIIVLPR